jgi:hypothetical protein
MAHQFLPICMVNGAGNLEGVSSLPVCRGICENFDSMNNMSSCSSRTITFKGGMHVWIRGSGASQERLELEGKGHDYERDWSVPAALERVLTPMLPPLMALTGAAAAVSRLCWKPIFPRRDTEAKAKEPEDNNFELTCFDDAKTPSMVALRSMGRRARIRPQLLFFCLERASRKNIL